MNFLFSVFEDSLDFFWCESLNLGRKSWNVNSEDGSELLYVRKESVDHKLASFKNWRWCDLHERLLGQKIDFKVSNTGNSTSKEVNHGF